MRSYKFFFCAIAFSVSPLYTPQDFYINHSHLFVFCCMKFTRFIVVGLYGWGLIREGMAAMPENDIIPAKPVVIYVTETGDANRHSQPVKVSFSPQELAENPSLTEGLLNRAIEENDVAQIENLLKIYRTFSPQDPILVKFAQAKLAKSQGEYTSAITSLQDILQIDPELTPVRIELAILLFLDQQDNQAKAQFNQALNAPHLPADIARHIRRYLITLEERSSWQFSGNAGYLREKNVNNASRDTYIENTAFQKGESMLPQKAHGWRINVSIEREKNLFNGHYLYLGQQLYSKIYWDNHQFDDITSRTYLGYRHKLAKMTWSILPFYTRQWYGGHRYQKGGGLRGEWDYRFNPAWQFSLALERSRSLYAEDSILNGHNSLFSFTTVWRYAENEYLYGGLDYSLERTQARRYDYDYKGVRFGWVKAWSNGVVTRLNGSLAKRQYKDNLVLGNVFYFDRARKDKIYTLNATIWQRDWHILGITPKLNLTWKKQQSNFDSLYSYTDRNINLLFEKTF